MNRTFIILLFIVAIILTGTISAANHYVDKDASGANNGTSWNDAWQSFSSINWGSIQPGDIVYISGGANSKTYSQQLTIGASGSSGNPILITKGITSGHNGEVIIDGSYSITHCVLIESKSYVTLQYLTCRGSSSTLFRINPGFNIVIDSLRFPLVDRGHGAIWQQNSGPIEIMRCYIETCTNCGSQTDGVYSQRSVGKISFHDNYVWIRNSDAGNHCDCWQSYLDADLDIYNNYCEQDNNKTSNAQGYFTEQNDNGSTLRFWNNIYNFTQSSSNAINFKMNGATGITYEVIGNTIYGEAGASNSIRFYAADGSPTVKNNVIHFVGPSGNGIKFSGGSANSNNVAYNLQSNVISTVGSNVITGNPLFSDPSGKDFTLQDGSPAIDAGTDMNSPYNVDMVGTFRPQGSGFDMGSYENYSGPDVTPPQLLGATINSPTQVTLFFSEPLESQSAQNASNYSIDNGINVISAVLSSNSREVTLTTSEHASTNNYTVTVSNVTDVAGNVISSQANSAQYFFEVDITAPQLLNAFAIVPTQVTLFFLRGFRFSISSKRR